LPDPPVEARIVCCFNALVSLTELRGLLARHARPDQSTTIDDVLISKVTQSAAPAASMTGTVLAVVAQGAKRLALGNRVYEYGAGQYVVASVDLPVIGHFIDPGPEHPALGLGLMLRPAAVAELLLQAGPGALPPDKGGTPSGIAVSDAPAELLDAAIRLVRLLDQPGDAPVLAPLIKKEILWRVMTGDQGAVVRQLGLADSNLTHIARAVQWIRDHYTTSFRVQELARLSGMSVSAFYRHFQTVTAMSPIQYQKQIRLQQARLLLATRPDDVTGVSRSVGYESPSQFSREYRRQFGAPPTQDTAVRHREILAAAP
jgi:AraC-like DNA-binding protein